MRPSYVNRRLCLQRWLGLDVVMPAIEGYLQPRYSRRNMRATLDAIRSLTCGSETNGPWVVYHHLDNERCIGRFTVRQCPQCQRIVQFYHVHGASSLLFRDPCPCLSPT